MKKTTLSSFGGIVAAIAASLCCIGPAVFALIGAGSIGAFSAFETFRPYLIGFTVLLLGLAFYFTYRKREVQCENGTCKVESAGSVNKISLWFAVLIAGSAIAYPYLGTSSAISKNSSEVPHASVALKIEGMTCSGCAKGIQGTLASLKGVQKATIEFEQGKGVIEYDSTLVQPNVFVEQVDKVGYHASIIDERKGN